MNLLQNNSPNITDVLCFCFDYKTIWLQNNDEESPGKRSAKIQLI